MFLLVIGGEARAATLYTGVVEGGNSCQVVNTSASSIIVTVEIFNFDGTLSFGQTVGLGPGLVYGVGAIPTQQAYCKIITSGGKNSVRGTFCRTKANGKCFSGIAEAR